MAEHSSGRPRPTQVDVCVCTFRRESVVATLESLAAQGIPPATELRVIVADNDETPSARDRVAAAAGRLALDLRYRHCPARNISIARNGALDAADGDWVAFIDDDETAAPGWLAALLSRAAETGADVVLGPVRPLYRPEAPSWMRAGAFHATEPVTKGGRIVAGYTSNALMRRMAPAAEGQRFDLALGRSGGEDTEFFDRLIARGARIAYAPDAVVSEVVPPDRARLDWLLRRRFRFGQTHGALLARNAQGPAQRMAAVLLAAGKAAVSGGGVVLNGARPERRAFWALRAALHLGAVSRLCGLSEITQYGTADAPSQREDADTPPS